MIFGQTTPVVDSDRKWKFQRFWPARSDCNNLALIDAVAAIIFGDAKKGELENN